MNILIFWLISFPFGRKIFYGFCCDLCTLHSVYYTYFYRADPNPDPSGPKIQICMDPDPDPKHWMLCKDHLKQLLLN